MNLENKELLLYAVTDRTWLNGRALAQCVEEAILGGATLVQLREKDLSYDDFKNEAIEVLSVCKKHGVKLLINDNVQLAKEINADGVHVGQSDLDAISVRDILGPEKIIGVTAKTIEQAKKAQRMGADYLGSGAVFGTSTKLDAKPMDLELFRSITKSVEIPVVAIGGISISNIERLAGSGAAGAAVVSGIFAADDIKERAKELRCICNKIFE